MKFWELTIFCLLTIIFGIFGFYLSIVILTPKDESPTFFEIKFNNEKKSKVENLLRNRIIKLNDLIPTLKSQLNSLGPEEESPNNLEEESSNHLDVLALNPEALDKNQNKKKELTAKHANSVQDTNKVKRSDLKRKLEIATTILSQSIKELNELVYYNKDTSSNYYVDYIWGDRNQILNSLTNDNLDTKSKLSSLKFYIIDTSLLSIDENSSIIKDSIGAEMDTPPRSKVSFINQYPLFGFWLVFSIGQMTIWFIIAIIVIGITIKAIIKTYEN